MLDPFGGSGSTLIACEQLERECRTIEIDPVYADVIVNRYIAFKDSDEDVVLVRNECKIPYKDIKADEN